jgi:anaerobic dimethyl sulfoxide reductase subunit B (iron-sulfur subunit)
MKVTCIEEGKFPDVFVSYLTRPCYHCAEPTCVESCPVDAITKREEDGIVVVDREACLGETDCGACLDACPYGAPQFGDEENPKMQKCDLCLERWDEGRKPICVEGCPLRALDAGPMEELREKYGESHEAAGFSYDAPTKASVIMKGKVNPFK